MARRCYLENVSFAQDSLSIFWYGIRGLQWCCMIEELKKLSASWPEPDILILHADNLGKVKTTDLIWEMQRDLTWIKCLLPKVVIVFSEIVPRLSWARNKQVFFLKKIRKHVNKWMEKFLPLFGDVSHRHVHFEGCRADLIHLTFLISFCKMAWSVGWDAFGGPRPLRALTVGCCHPANGYYMVN